MGGFETSDLFSSFSLLSEMKKNQRKACLECGRKIHVKIVLRHRKKPVALFKL